MKRLFPIFMLLASLWLAGCRGASRHVEEQTHDNSGDTVTTYSSLLTIIDRGDSSIALLTDPWRRDAAPQRIALSKSRGLQSAVVFSSVHAAAMIELGATDAITGVADASFFKLPAVVERLADGRIKDMGNSQAPSVEAIIELSPDLIVLSPYQDSDFEPLRRTGIRVVEMADYMETSPLGRAEWIKLLGRLFGRAAEADSIFAEVESRYNALKDKAKGNTSAPKVLTEMPYSGVWYVPGGRSYMANMIADAGGRYAWADNGDTGSLPLDPARVLNDASDADIWLVKTFADADLRLSDISDALPLATNFKAFTSGGVWCANTAKAALFEEFPFHPERLLSDFIIIFGGGDSESCRYYQPVTRR